MIDPRKIVLELILLAGVIILVRKHAKSRHRTFVLWFSGTAFVLNAVFYLIAVQPLFVSLSKSQGFTASAIQSAIWFDIIKWAVLAYCCGRFVVEVRLENQGGGFLLIDRSRPLWTIPIMGILGGLTTTLLYYALSYAEQSLGLMEAIPWPYYKESDLYLKLGVWGGIHNLAGEEIITRLGVQSVLLYVLGNRKFSAFWAILISSVYFEFWHNGFRDLYFLNFTASFAFGIIYQKFGYESAAVSHCVSDWTGLVAFPRLFF